MMGDDVDGDMGDNVDEDVDYDDGW